MVRSNGNAPFNYETVAAAGGSTTDATSVPSKASPALVVVTGGNGVAGVKLPAAPTQGSKMFVIVNTATGGFNQLNVYPSGTNTINGGTAGAAYQMAAGSAACFVSTKTGGWYTFPQTAS